MLETKYTRALRHAAMAGVLRIWYREGFPRPKPWSKMIQEVNSYLPIVQLNLAKDRNLWVGRFLFK